MAPSINFAIPHEYAKVRSPRRISSNGWGHSEILMKKPEDESNAEREEVEILMRRSSTGMLHPRICANCRTSKTPLWRSGPTGPKVSSIRFSIFLFELRCNSWMLLFPLFLLDGCFPCKILTDHFRV